MPAKRRVRKSAPAIAAASASAKASGQSININVRPISTSQSAPSTTIGPDDINTFGSYQYSGVDFLIQGKNHGDFLEIYLPVPLADQYRCQCGYETENHNSLKQHFAVCSKSSIDFTFFCDICQDKFDRLREARNHHRHTHTAVTKEFLIEATKKHIKATNIKKVIKKVKKGEWLNDAVVDFALCSEVLVEMEGSDVLRTVLPSEARRALDKFKEGSTFLQGSFDGWVINVPVIYFPVNHNDTHWSLLVLDSTLSQARHYDSLPKPANMSNAKESLRVFCSFVESRFGCTTFGSLKFVEIACPQQNDGKNCGVHCIFNGKADTMGKFPTQTDGDCNSWRSVFPSQYSLRPRQSVSPVFSPLSQGSVQPPGPQTNPIASPSPTPAVPPIAVPAGSVDEILKALKPYQVMKRIPKGARTVAAKALSSVLKTIVQENSTHSWLRLFAFPSFCLRRPQKGEACRNMTSFVKENIAKFLADPQLLEMPSPLQPGSKNRKEAPKPKDESKYLKSQVRAKLADFDVKGAVRLLSSDDSLAPVNDETYQSLLKKHPPAPPSSTLPPVPPRSPRKLSFESKDVQKGLLTFPNGSSGGTEGLSPTHLKDLTALWLGDAGADLLDSLAKFCELVIQGEVPPDIVPYFCGARLVALNKKCGGIRPIAVGMSLRRLCAKLCNQVILPGASGVFNPYQVGFGVKGGAEAAVHAVQDYVASNKDSGEIMLKIDFKNAFNSIDRGDFLKLVETHFPEIYPFVYMYYSQASSLSWRDRNVSSESGVQQGDPLGPFLFCLAINHIVRKLKSKVNIWYLDDGTLIGDTDIVLADFQTVIELGQAMGLDVNFLKCEIFILGGIGVKEKLEQKLANMGSPAVQVLGMDKAVLLGGAFHGDAVPGLLHGKLNNLRIMVQRLKMIGRHEALFLLRNCFAIPKVTYILRTSMCHGQPLLQEYDKCTMEALESLLNCNLSPLAYSRARLPIKFGGLGVRSARDLALPAFLSSYNGTKALRDELLKRGTLQGSLDGQENLGICLEAWESLQLELPIEKSRGVQKCWDQIQCKRALETISGGPLIDTEKASVLAAAGPKSGAWLNALPIENLGLKLTDEQVRISASVRVGARVCEHQLCVCGATIETNGLHPLSCGKVQGRWSRHHEVNSVIQRSLASAQIPAIQEPVGLSRADGKRPDGMTLIPWENGRAAIWDFTCTDTTAPSNLSTSLSGAGKSANAAERRKRAKYTALADEYIFIPVAIETHGAWGESALDFVSKIGGKMAERTADKRATAFLSQTISMAIQRGNASCVMSAIKVGVPMKTYLDV